LGWRWRHSLIWVYSVLIVLDLPKVSPSDSPNNWYQSGLRRLPLEGECINVVEEGLTLGGEIIRYSSMSRSPTLGKNEKVEQHIRKKTRKPNALRFWVEGDVILLYGFTQFSLFEISPKFPSRILPTILKFH